MVSQITTFGEFRYQQLCSTFSENPSVTSTLEKNRFYLTDLLEEAVYNPSFSSVLWLVIYKINSLLLLKSLGEFAIIQNNRKTLATSLFGLGIEIDRNMSLSKTPFEIQETERALALQRDFIQKEFTKINALLKPDLIKITCQLNQKMQCFLNKHSSNPSCTDQCELKKKIEILCRISTKSPKIFLIHCLFLAKSFNFPCKLPNWHTTLQFLTQFADTERPPVLDFIQSFSFLIDLLHPKLKRLICYKLNDNKSPSIPRGLFEEKTRYDVYRTLLYSYFLFTERDNKAFPLEQNRDAIP